MEEQCLPDLHQDSPTRTHLLFSVPKHSMPAECTSKQLRPKSEPNNLSVNALAVFVLVCSCVKKTTLHHLVMHRPTTFAIMTLTNAWVWKAY